MTSPEAGAPYKNRPSSVISAAARTFETGQFFFAVSAISWNFAASMPGTLALVVRWIFAILNPASSLIRSTLALVSIFFGGVLLRVSAPERAIE